MKNLSSSYDTLVKKASYLRIAARDLAESMKSGNFRSLYRGQGIEFSGVRDYIRGDDIRAIDWNVTARMGRPYVKVFEEERELQLLVIVDSSVSMQLEADGKSKFEVAAETAALIILASELNGCPVGSVFFDGELYFSCKPKAGREQTMLLLTHLERVRAKAEAGTVLPNALSAAGKLLRKRALVFVLSDFRAAGWEKPLISLAQKNDVVAVRIQNSYDEELPSLGAVPFKDAESGMTMVLPSSSAGFKKEWKNQNEMSVRYFQETCTKHGARPVIMKAFDEPMEILSGIFSANSRTGR